MLTNIKKKVLENKMINWTVMDAQYMSGSNGFVGKYILFQCSWDSCRNHEDKESPYKLSLSYNTKNDKAFASAGNVTNKYMACPRLIKPIIKKGEIKEIIQGGGQHLLSPERRFDAILFNSPGLFI